MTEHLDEPTGRRAGSTDGGQRSERREGVQVSDLSLFEVANILLRKRKLALLLPLVLVFLVVGWTLISEARYTSSSTFMPQQGGQQLSGLSNLASQFGVEIPTGPAGQSPQFYAELVESPEFLRRLAASKYPVPADDASQRSVDSLPLSDHLDVEAETPERTLFKTARRLRHEVVEASTTIETGLVNVTVTTHSPALSHQIAERILDLINEFNVEKRQSEAAARRTFVEQRLAMARAELGTAEDSLREFLERNRQYQSSPSLVFEHQRLQRQVNIKNQVVSSLAQSLEEARIDEVRNTPVITVVEEPVRPVFHDSKYLRLRILLALLIGGLLAAAWALGYEFVQRARADAGEEFREFQRLRDEVQKEIRHLTSRFPWKSRD